MHHVIPKLSSLRLGLEVRGAGLHQALLNGTDDAGRRLASGVYRMRLVTPDGARSRPIVMLK